MKKLLLVICIILFSLAVESQQVKILFDATKAESAGNADWVIDADTHNLGYSNGPPVVGQGNESNPQQLPIPGQSTVTQSTSETYWEGGISAWGIDCVKQGYWVETLPYNGQITYGNTNNTQDLSNYKVFIVCEPNIVFTSAEKTAILQFVQNGGGLFMVSDHNNSDRNNDGYDSPHIWNDLMSNNSVQSNPFGMTFDYADFSQTTTNIPNLPSDPLLHGPMGNVTSAMWSNGTSMTLTPSANSSVTGVIYKSGSSFGNSNVMVAHATYENGKVVGFGDSSPCDDGTGDPNDQLFHGWTGDANGNHERLIMNATIWLATSNGPAVTTLPASNIAMTSATLNGSVNPNGVATTWHFEYGTSTSYGNSTSVVSAGSGTSAVSVNANISNLSTATLYHFRLVGVAGSNTVYGTDLQFTTLTPTLTLTPSNQNVPATPAGSTSFTVTSNSSWTVVSDQTWCTVTLSGTGNGTITANYAVNTLTTSRVANITVTVTGLTPVLVTVTQSGAAPTLAVTPPSQTVTSLAGTTNFTVTSNSNWTAASDASWCSVPSSGSGSGTLTATYQENPMTAIRTANITITVAGIFPVIVSVVQDGVVGIADLQAGIMRIIPNPATGLFQIVPGISGTIQEINILDLTGRVIVSRKCNSNSDYLFDLSASPQGYYLVKVKMSDNEIVVYCFLISK